jgi:hypothetical protein
MLRFWGTLAILTLAIVAPMLGSAAVPSQYAGRWAVQSGRSNLLIVDITAATTQNPAGATYLRPEHFELFANGNGVRGISGPYVSFPSVRMMQEDNDLDMTFADPAKPMDMNEIRFSMIDVDHGEIQFVGASLPPISVLRIKNEDGPYTKWAADHTYGITDNHPTNAAMTAIFDADQADRRETPIDWTIVGKADAARRSEVEKLLASGQLHTGEDYVHAAFVFQHGDNPRDYLLAHTLAMVAATKREPNAIWIASATLDRYLQMIGQPQIFGTQFKTPKDGAVTQEPYDRALISDALRVQLHVDTLAEQEAQRSKIQATQASQNPP